MVPSVITQFVFFSWDVEMTETAGWEELRSHFVLFEFQSGLRAAHLPETCLFICLASWNSEGLKKHLTAWIITSIKAALNGFRHTAIKTFTSYRKHSSLWGWWGLTTTSGYDTWRAAGPRLFHVLTNHTPVAANYWLLLYADRYRRKELLSGRERLVDNKRSIHLGKTESILFGSKKKLDVKLRLQLWNMRGRSCLWTRRTGH